MYINQHSEKIKTPELAQRQIFIRCPGKNKNTLEFLHTFYILYIQHFYINTYTCTKQVQQLIKQSITTEHTNITVHKPQLIQIYFMNECMIDFL